MDLLSMLRTLGALGLVLGMLATALWVVRRYDLKLPGRAAGGGRKRVELVERLAVDAKRSVALIRRDGCEHLILIGPEGHATIETGIIPPAQPAPEAVAEPEMPARIEEDLANLKAGVAKLAGKLDFKAMVEKLRPDAPATAGGDAETGDAETGDAEKAMAEPAGMDPVADAESRADGEDAAEAPVPASAPLPVAANDVDAEAPRAERTRARKAGGASSRNRVPRDTTRWNKRAVREALDA